MYGALLGALGWHALGGFDGAPAPEGVPSLFGFGDSNYRPQASGGSSLWLGEDDAHPVVGMHVSLAAPDRSTVDVAYAAAITAGARGQRHPGVREYFGHSYYAADITDTDGNHVEIVFKG